jgi:hypothetical protein
VAWREALSAEKNVGLLSNVGATRVIEGFAEFGGLLLSEAYSREQMKDLMPKCLKVWEHQGP